MEVEDVSDIDQLFSRSNETSLFGKCTADVRTKLPEEDIPKLMIIANQAGYSSIAEYLRMVLFIIVHGEEEVSNRVNHRLNSVLSLGLGQGSNRADK